MEKNIAFRATAKLRKQVDGVSVGGTLSIILSDCFMNKMERDIVLPFKKKFYRQFVDGTHSRRKKNEPEELFSKMNSYHTNINLKIEINPSKSLDTKIEQNKNEIRYFSHHKNNKLFSLEIHSIKKLWKECHSRRLSSC